MDSKNSDNDGISAKPFQLRPSTLSSSTLSAGTSRAAGFEQQSKSFALRPSALTAIADKMESSDPRKRQMTLVDDSGDNSDEETGKRQKLSSTDENGLNLTEPIQKPSGIGSFGFENSNYVATNGSASNEKETSQSSPGFIFGQNVTARVTGFQDIPSEQEQKSNHDGANVSATDADKERLLMEAADEHMQNLSKNRPQLQEVETFTGEEGERNVLMIQCRIHLYNSSKKAWVEKGRGTVKLNDICQSEHLGVFQSRLVFRTQGNHLVVFNTKLWPQMKCEKASEKSIRITAMDAEAKEVRIYLITATIKDIVQLFTAIDRRIQALKRNQDSLQSSVDESGDSNDNESRVADDEDSHSEDTRSSASHSLDRTHDDGDQDPEQSNDSYCDPQETSKDHRDEDDTEDKEDTDGSGPWSHANNVPGFKL